MGKFNELAWVEFLKKTVTNRKDVLLGIGDDCAVVKVGKEKLLLKSDLFIEGIHFISKGADYKVIGMRAVGRVLSDFAACGGWPLFIGASLGIPKNIKFSQIKDILAGINYFAKKYKFSFIGGDTCRTKKFFLDVWGVAKVSDYVKRSSAKEGDFIFISGQLGKCKFTQTFIPRLEQAQYLVNNFKINSMIDISDGFTLDLYRLLEESSKGAEIFYDKLPTTSGKKDLYRGEDYELIFTIDKQEPKIAKLKERFFCVGQIKNKDFGYKMNYKGKLKQVKVRGYTHF